MMTSRNRNIANITLQYYDVLDLLYKSFDKSANTSQYPRLTWKQYRYLSPSENEVWWNNCQENIEGTSAYQSKVDLFRYVEFPACSSVVDTPNIFSLHRVVPTRGQKRYRILRGLVIVVAQVGLCSRALDSECKVQTRQYPRSW